MSVAMPPMPHNAIDAVAIVDIGLHNPRAATQFADLAGNLRRRIT